MPPGRLPSKKSAILKNAKAVPAGKVVSKLQLQAEKYENWEKLKAATFIKPVDVACNKTPNQFPQPEFIEYIYKLILMGAHPDVAARSMGVTKNTFDNWLRKGYEYITKDEQGIAQDVVKEAYANLLLAVDAGTAQEEINNVAALTLGSPNWQANLAVLERKYSSRWGAKQALDVTNSFNFQEEKKTEVIRPSANVADMLTAMEESGMLHKLAAARQLGSTGDNTVIDADSEEVPPEETTP